MFRELELTYKGVDYRVKPTMDLIRRLELAGVGPFAMAGRVANRDQCFAVYALFLATILRYAGAEVDDAEIYAEQTNAAALLGLIERVAVCVACLLPPSPVPVEGDAGGKPKAATTRRRSGNGSRQPRSS